MKFDYMNEAVDELCYAMVNNPGRFSVGVHTMTDTKTGVEYWISTTGGSGITDTWNGRSNNTVFSYEQGKRLRDAFTQMREIKASNAQQRILNASQKTDDNEGGSDFPIMLVICGVLLLICIITMLLTTVAR